MHFLYTRTTIRLYLLGGHVKLTPRSGMRANRFESAAWWFLLHGHPTATTITGLKNRLQPKTQPQDNILPMVQESIFYASAEHHILREAIIFTYKSLQTILYINYRWRNTWVKYDNFILHILLIETKKEKRPGKEKKIRKHENIELDKPEENAWFVKQNKWLGANYWWHYHTVRRQKMGGLSTTSA